MRPALMSLIPWRISLPMSRDFSHFANCFSVIFRIFYSLFHLLQDVRRNGCPYVLAVERQHPDLATCEPQVIDDTQTATLAVPLGTPAKLPHASRSRNELSGIGMFAQMSLQLPVLVIIEVPIKCLGEERSFDKFEHCPILRQCRIHVHGFRENVGGVGEGVL